MARSLDGGGAVLAQAVFLGEGIMMEVIFAGGEDPGRSRTCRRMDLATILADSVVLLQTPAVGQAY